MGVPEDHGKHRRSLNHGTAHGVVFRTNFLFMRWFLCTVLVPFFSYSICESLNVPFFFATFLFLSQR